MFGLHRFYLGKWLTGLLYLLTVGLLLIGVLYDFCTLNTQVSDLNRQQMQPTRLSPGPVAQ